MRRSLAPFSRPESSVHTRSLADFIITMSGFRFSVHTVVSVNSYVIVRPHNWAQAKPYLTEADET